MANSFKGRMLHLERSLEDRNIKVNVTPRFLNPPLPAKLVNSIKRSVERRSLVYFSEYGISREYYFTLRHFRNDGGSSIMIIDRTFRFKRSLERTFENCINVSSRVEKSCSRNLNTTFYILNGGDNLLFFSIEFSLSPLFIN